MVFHWLFILWLQKELDQYRDRANNSWKQWDRSKVLPHGVPELILGCTEDYGALDFKVMVSLEAIEHIRQLYLKPEHLVFDLIPLTLSHFIQECYHQLGSPPVQRKTIWMVYLELLSLLWQREDITPFLIAIAPDDMQQDEDLPLIGGLQDLPGNDYYMGGVGNGIGLHE
ncbi:hypothetical protein PAXRUDRAFT_163038 [Paxillus rubicundulus Ve08.2h10]|uniref:Uncharacterized protein n=1 Tax=Paxillus rubicundulus Ve08.2h10 TaxID=930991 RepID=A0A0D0DKL8_9AGAM|nr:hypothetical protein PAXRUDRAFT_163038 [Paxillus rubicundulus Ve08.2h10]